MVPSGSAHLRGLPPFLHLWSWAVGSAEGAGPIVFVWVFSDEGAGVWYVWDGMVVWCVWVRGLVRVVSEFGDMSRGCGSWGPWAGGLRGKGKGKGGGVWCGFVR